MRLLELLAGVVKVMEVGLRHPGIDACSRSAAWFEMSLRAANIANLRSAGALVYAFRHSYAIRLAADGLLLPTRS